MHMCSQRRSPVIGLHAIDQALEQRALACAVGAEDSPAFAALHLKRQILKQRPIVTFAKLFGTKHNIAGSLYRRETHHGRANFTRGADTLNTFQLFLAIFAWTGFE